ncbi:hypothetical protein ES319_A06G000700v1, partial [Gossypium barbadense]
IFSLHGYIHNHTKLPIQLMYRDTIQNSNNPNYFKENIPNTYGLMQAPSSIKKKTYMHTRIMTISTVNDHEA